jgi:hypothetical protein
LIADFKPELGSFDRRSLGSECADPGLDADDVARFEDPEGLAHNGAADSELHGKLALRGESRLILIHSGSDPTLDARRHLLGKWVSVVV